MIRKLNEYRFYTVAPIQNPLRDRRHRRGLLSLESVPSGTEVRVEVAAATDKNGTTIGEPIKHYVVLGQYVTKWSDDERMTRLFGVLAAYDPGSDEKPRSLDDLARRNFCDPQWFAYEVLRGLLRNGRVTLDEVASLYGSSENDG